MALTPKPTPKRVYVLLRMDHHDSIAPDTAGELAARRAFSSDHIVDARVLAESADPRKVAQALHAHMQAGPGMPYLTKAPQG
jgi:hypothetical protein